MLCHITACSGTSGSLSLNNKNVVFDDEQEKNPLFVCGWDKKKSVPHDHLLSPLGKPGDANR